MKATSTKVFLPLLACFSTLAVASDEAVDPGDHTKVNTAASITYGIQSLGEDDNNYVQVQGQISGSKANGNLFLGVLNVTARENGKVGDDGFNASQVRARYFEVTPTGWDTAPVFGMSFDYIDTSFTDGLSDRLFAVGAVLRVNPGFDNWLLFPNLAAVVGQNNDDFSDAGLVDDTSYGGQLNLFNTIYFNKNGSHIQFNPQFSVIDMGSQVGTVQTLQLETAVMIPFDENRKHWGKLTYNEYFDDAGQSFGHNDKNTELKFTYYYYF